MVTGFGDDTLFSNDFDDVLCNAADQSGLISCKLNLFKCKRCGKSYKYKTSLNLHCRVKCGHTPKFQCLVCSRKFFYNGHLKMHVISKHQTTV